MTELVERQSLAPCPLSRLTRSSYGKVMCANWVASASRQAFKELENESGVPNHHYVNRTTAAESLD